MAPPPQTPTAKKSKKSRKPKVLSLQAFLATNDNAAPPGTVLKKLKNFYDDESDESSGSPVVYELPTVPLCERPESDREQPQYSRKREQRTEQVYSNWRSGSASSSATNRKPPTEDSTRSTGAIRKHYKQEERPSHRTESTPSTDLSSWRSPTETDGRPKLKLQPRSLPLPAIVQLPEVPTSERYAMPEPEDVKITIKKRLIDDHDRDGVPCDSGDKMGDRLRAAAESMNRLHLYVSKGDDDGRASANWRQRQPGQATHKYEPSSTDEDDEDGTEKGKRAIGKQMSSSNDSSEA